MPLPYHPTEKDGRVVKDLNILRVLKAVRHFGHLRRQELAIAVWPKSSAKSAYIMACRTVTHMLKEGFLLERQNALAGKSLVLSARGVAKLRDVDIQAQEGYDLAYDGPTFFHRTLGTSYLLEKARSGDQVYGEYALLRGWSPLDRVYTRERFNKVPDGLIIHSGKAHGLRIGVNLADWVEVESAFKSYDEVKKALSLLTKDSQLTKDGSLILGKLVFVYDSRQRHERQLLRYIKKFLKENPQLSEQHVMEEIIFARCYVDVPLVWHGMQEATAWQMAKDTEGALQDHDSVLDDE